MSGAPIGNKNAAKGRDWQEAVKRALARYANSNVSKGLDKAADLFVKAVMAGDQWALKELGDRIDGRPHQSMDIGVYDTLPAEEMTDAELATELAATRKLIDGNSGKTKRTKQPTRIH